MRKSAFYKDVFRTIRDNLPRFMAVVVMTALGIGVFTGFTAGCMDVLDSADYFYDKQNTYDIKIVSTLGLVDDDISAVSNLENVSTVFGNCSMDVLMTQKNGNQLLASVTTLDTDGMNEPYVLEGILPKKSGQVAVTSKFINDTGLQIGETITLEEGSTGDDADPEDTSLSENVDEAMDFNISTENEKVTPTLAVAKYEITAIILSPLNISNNEGNLAATSLSSSSIDYMMYITKGSIKSDVYTAVYLTLDGTVDMDCYSEEYRILVEDMIAAIENTIQDEREQARYEEVIEAAAKQFDDKQGELAEGMQKLTEGKQEIEDAATELTEGQEELDNKRSDYEDSIATVKQKLSDAKEDIEIISMTKWYVWDRSENDSFDGLDNDISFILAVTKAFPIIFFLVAILVCLTTMTRMVEEDRTLIGTYKSLGYTKRQISLKYILFAVLACAIGGILGIVIGFFALPKVIWIIVKTMYVLPAFGLSFYPVYGLGGVGVFLLGILGATILASAEMLHKRPAELMRPKAPKEGNRILLERIPFIWKRLKFLNKVTWRNLFRYKKRAIMTIVGILGCMMLIVLGFGVRDTVGGVMPDQFNNVTVYDAIVVTNNLNTDEMDLLAGEVEASGMVKEKLQLQITTLTLRSSSDNIDITVMVIPDGADFDSYVHLKDIETNNKKSLPTEGIVVTQNAAKQLKLKNGDTISLQNQDNLEYDFPVAFITNNNIGNYIYLSESCYQEAFGDYARNSFVLNLVDHSKGEEWLDRLSEDGRILSVSSSQDAIDTFRNVKEIVNMVVYLLISMSAILALTVLFTLSNINVSERERELATIKVLGFKRKEVYTYVNKETLILTLLGILLGMPAGYGITYAILSNVSIADIAFNVRVSAAAYLTSAILTVIFTLLVNKITNKTLRKIHMVEALKSIE